MVTAQTDTGALSQPNVGEENAMVCRESSSAQLSFDLHTKRRNAVSLTVKECFTSNGTLYNDSFGTSRYLIYEQNTRTYIDKQKIHVLQKSANIAEIVYFRVWQLVK